MIAVTGGGTGGHIFPNVAVIEELQGCGVTNICWIGDRRGKEIEWAHGLGVAFYGIRTGKLRRYFSLQNLADTVNVLIGIAQSYRILKKSKPAVLFSKGGFVSVPPAIAAGLLHVPVITHESDIHPGMATKIIAKRARAVCVSFEKAAASFEGKEVYYTGNPMRATIRSANRERGKSFLHFTEDLPIVTVLGGSLGASSLNGAVFEMLEEVELPFNLVHQCGRGHSRRFESGHGRYRQYEFIADEMGDVLAASDLIISRAGAGALYEIGCLGLPSILIPLPRSKSRGEQIDNANFFQENGAAQIIEDGQLSSRLLAEAVSDLLSDTNLLGEMGQNASKLCKRDAEREIADILMRVGAQSPVG
jgi:UDP-N-acetylglucosamine--N-acetylmuramyl-(pentapeptide) pyrophosphoryl-undecaprenol N-acetylglucosamine transferase